MKNEKCGIYAIRRIQTGEAYIGSSVQIYTRFSQHRKLLRLGTHHAKHLQYTWTKYREDAFEFVILEECEVGMLLLREQFYINEFGTYNWCPAAGSRLGSKQSPETIEKVRQTHLGRKNSAETIAKMREAALGNKRGLGCKHSPEAIERSRRGSLGRPSKLKGIPRAPEVIEKIRRSNIITKSRDKCLIKHG